jgi:hypothetical protein
VILDDAKAKLDQAVKDGNLTQAEADQVFASVKAHVDDLVDHGFFRFRFHERHDGSELPGAHPFW